MNIWAGGRVRICHPGIICERLEQRIVLNATVPPPADHAQPSSMQDTAETAYTAGSGDPVVGSDPTGNQLEAASELTKVFENDLNVVLISDALDDIQGISDAAGEAAGIIVFDADQDDFSSLNALLGDLTASTGRQIGVLSLFSHGNDGWFSVGTDSVNFFNVNSFSSDFAQLSTFLTADAQIQLYACSLASDFFGQSVVDYMASATGAVVFASDDPTGGPSGDWDLEYASDAQGTLAILIDSHEAANLETELAASYPAYEDNWATSWNGVLFYAYDDGVHGNELWQSDGTAAGTSMVADINVGNGDSDPSEMFVYNGALVFSASDGNSSADHGTELWRSDGTGAGTLMIADINPGNQSSDPGGFTAFNDTLFFSASDGNSGTDHGRELWSSDGTTAGTQMFLDINTGNLGSDPESFTVSNGKLFFSASDGTAASDHGTELWVSDGTPGGTRLVLDINSGNLGSDPAELTDVNGTLFFSASNGTSASDNGTELWRSDGTAAGTQMVLDINPGNQSSDPTELTNVNGTLFFSASDGNSGTDHGTELWSRDGTTGVTQMVLDINPGNQDSNPAELTDVDGTLYFAATDGINGTELWTSDGSAAGTNMVLDIMPGPGDSTPRFFNNYDGDLIFAADDGIHGYEPWFSDGTAAGTYLLKDINPSGSSFPINFARVNPLFFLADGGNGYELWKSDGTAEGTVRVSDVGPSTNPDVAGSADTTTSDSSTSAFQQSSRDSQSSRVGDDSADDGKDRIDESQAPITSTDGRGFTTKSVEVQSLVGDEATEQSESQNVSRLGGKENPQDGLPPQFVPGLVKVIVLADGDYSVSLGKISLVIGSNMWLPSMVQWYLAAVSEGNYRFGSLPTDYERMIWDFLTYLERHKAGDEKNPNEMELRLAWQWADWRRQVFKEHGTKEVLPWDYFQGLSKSLTVFYAKHAHGKLDYSVAVNALKHNAANLSILPVKLPEETLAKLGSPPQIRR